MEPNKKYPALFLMRGIGKGDLFMQKINPCLWYDNNAEEAVNFYISIFTNSKIGRITRHNKATVEASG